MLFRSLETDDGETRIDKIMRKMNWRIWKNIKLPRGKFLKRLDWYIIKKFLGTYVFAIALIISIAVVFDFNEKMDRFMSHEAPWNAIVFDYYLNFIPRHQADCGWRQYGRAHGGKHTVSGGGRLPHA